MQHFKLFAELQKTNKPVTADLFWNLGTYKSVDIFLKLAANELFAGLWLVIHRVGL